MAAAERVNEGLQGGGVKLLDAETLRAHDLRLRRHLLVAWDSSRVAHDACGTRLLAEWRRSGEMVVDDEQSPERKDEQHTFWWFWTHSLNHMSIAI